MSTGVGMQGKFEEERKLFEERGPDPLCKGWGGCGFEDVRVQSARGGVSAGGERELGCGQASGAPGRAGSRKRPPPSDSGLRREGTSGL